MLFLDLILRVWLCCLEEQLDAERVARFFAESRVRRADDGWRNTVFNWHAPTVRQAVNVFDEMFDAKLSRCEGGREHSCRDRAISEIRGRIAFLNGSVERQRISRIDYE